MVFQKPFSQKKKKGKIPFFFLGPKNDWKKILEKDLQIKISSAYKNEFVELGYN